MHPTHTHTHTYKPTLQLSFVYTTNTYISNTEVGHGTLSPFVITFNKKQHHNKLMHADHSSMPHIRLQVNVQMSSDFT